MNSSENPESTSRRTFLKTTAAASVLAGVKLPFVYAAEDNTQQIALVGCGGRGTGAAANALAVTGPPIKLVAMADIFENRLKGSLNGLQNQYKAQVDVPADRQFIGFDGFKHAIDLLPKNGIVLFTTPPAFRWVHFKYAIDSGLKNVFMEKPISIDGPTTRRMLALNVEAEKKGMKVAVGLMCRHCRVRGELLQKVRAGDIGDILLLRAYRVQAPVASFRSKKRPAEIPELHYQIQRFHSFLWASGGAYSDFNIHNIDEACWMKDAWPVEAKGLGGRHFREDWIDQNFDSYSVEYTFADGTKLFLESRNMEGCSGEFATYAHGTKGLAIVSSAGHSPTNAKIFSGQRIKSEEIVWKAPKPEPNPYQTEWDDFIEAIRNDKPYNEIVRSAEASLITAMGRLSAHTGQTITRDEALNWAHEFAPDVDKLTLDSPAPVLAKADGTYPWPQPGVTTKSEY